MVIYRPQHDNQPIMFWFSYMIIRTRLPQDCIIRIHLQEFMDFRKNFLREST